MKVSELMAKLQSLPANADVLCYTENEDLLDIEEVSASDATKVRTTDDRPSLKFGKTENSQQHVLISVISDF